MGRTSLILINSMKHAGYWLINNQTLLINYTVNVIIAIFIICIGMTIANYIAKNLNLVFLARHIDITIANFISILLRYSIITFAVTAALNRVGVQTASIIAILGAAGLAVGLALQGSLSNFAAGVLLVSCRPLRVGEYVDLGGVSGIVQQIQIFSTTLLSDDGKTIIMPNGKVISANIVNYSREPIRRNEIILRVDTNADLNKVKQIIHKIVYTDTRIMKEREIIIRLHEIGTNYLNFIVRWWSKGSDLQNVYWDILERFKQAIDQNHD
ncbi:MAG: small-conductance mechanosensitive channel MscS [Candidatus Dasytiphilus stammeri]